jgi:radical SAM enzyme (rSAM/lipoprotein system)
MFQFLKHAQFQLFKKAAVEIHELSYLFWECTTRCNLHCLHCGSDCSKDSSQEDMPILPFLAALDTIKSVPPHFTVVLTGGEPLLRSDIETCGREIRKRNMQWGLVSNGYLYNENTHVKLLNAGLGALTISLDGLETAHNWLRNNPASFAKVDDAIKLAISSPRLNFDVVTCVNKKNAHELPAIYDYLVSRGVKAWRLFTVVPIGRAKDNAELFLSDLQFQHMLDFIVFKRKQKGIDVKFSCEGYVGKYELAIRDTPFFCRAGINIGSILADGSISACPNIDRSFAQGNVYVDNFFEVWNTRFQLFRNRLWTKNTNCGTCSHYRHCQGNGLHNWHGAKENVLVCHQSKLNNDNLV